MNEQAIDKLTPEDIRAMDYNEAVGLVRETNRPPGGAKSIAKIAAHSFLDPTSKVLEIGTSTGFTAHELAKLVGCHITAIDVLPLSLAEAKARAERDGVLRFIDFELQDASQTTYQDSAFDMVFCGNVTSLIGNREKALTEYCRVLRTGGFLAAIPMYYVRKPADEMVQRVSDALHVDIKPAYEDFWLDFFLRRPLELYWSENYAFDYIEDQKIDHYVDNIMSSSHLHPMKAETKQTLDTCYKEFIYLFRDNLSHMGYTLMLLRKDLNPIDPELFTARIVNPA